MFRLTLTAVLLAASFTSSVKSETATATYDDIAENNVGKYIRLAKGAVLGPSDSVRVTIRSVQATAQSEATGVSWDSIGIVLLPESKVLELDRAEGCGVQLSEQLSENGAFRGFDFADPVIQGLLLGQTATASKQLSTGSSDVERPYGLYLVVCQPGTAVSYDLLVEVATVRLQQQVGRDSAPDRNPTTIALVSGACYCKGIGSMPTVHVRCGGAGRPGAHPPTHSSNAPLLVSFRPCSNH